METKPTHEVIDLMYHEDEYGFYAYSGTIEECQQFVAEQSDVGYQIRPIIYK